MSLNRPWFKKFPRDWIGNAAVRRLSLPARGLLADLECLMHEARPYGHLLINGSKVSNDELARILGISPEVLRDLIPELIKAGILKMTRANVLTHPQMIAQDAAAQKGAAAVEKRYRPRDDVRCERDKREINGTKGVRSDIAQSIETQQQSRRPNRSPSRVPITHMSEDRSQINNNIDPTPIPRDAPPDGDQPLAFPATGSIAYIEPWRSIAKASGKNIDSDILAESFRPWLAKKKIPYDAPKIMQIFTSFVANHRA